MNWSRILWVKFVGALSALGCGLVLGREGPTVQIGGATGLGVAQVTGSTLREQRALMASGAGAGLAAAFNAPLAGVTFVLEELQRDFQPVVFGAALLCAAVATVISRLANGQFPVLTVPPIATPSLVYLPIFAVIGLGGGLLGVAFNRCLLAAINLVSRWRAKSALAVAAGLGILIAAAWSVSPILIGGGHAVTESALQGEIALAPVLLYLLIRFTLLHASYATGVPGGIFAPLLSMGALAGVGLFTLTAHLIPIPGLLLAACGVAGMCAMFSGVVRAPLTGIILIGEMTGSYGMLLPLLVAAFTAYAVAEAFGDTPIYEALLQRDSAIRGWLTEGDDPVTAEFEVKSGSEFEGKKLRDLGLPAGVVIIVCREGGREIVPNADTVLTNHMRIVVAASSTLKLGAVEAGVR
jgi:CIC family chloride channel protein